MIRLFNSKFKPIAEYPNLHRLCKSMGFRHDTVYKYFKRNPSELSYTIFEGSRCQGKPKYIIMRSKDEVK